MDQVRPEIWSRHPQAQRVTQRVPTYIRVPKLGRVAGPTPVGINSASCSKGLNFSIDQYTVITELKRQALLPVVYVSL